MFGINSLPLEIRLLIIGAGIAALLLLVKFFIRLPLFGSQIKIFVKRYLPVFSLIIFAVYLTISAAKLFPDQPVYWMSVSGLIVIIIIAAGWQVLQNIIKGILLKAEEAFAENQWISFKGVEGRIQKAGLRSLLVETEDGKNVRIPYSMLSKELMFKTDIDDNTKAYTFSLEIPSRHPARTVIEEINSAVLNSAWSSAYKAPDIQFAGTKAGKYIFEVTVYALSETFFPLIEENVYEVLKVK